MKNIYEKTLTHFEEDKNSSHNGLCWTSWGVSFQCDHPLHCLVLLHSTTDNSLLSQTSHPWTPMAKNTLKTIWLFEGTIFGFWEMSELFVFPGGRCVRVRFIEKGIGFVDSDAYRPTSGSPEVSKFQAAAFSARPKPTSTSDKWCSLLNPSSKYILPNGGLTGDLPR